MTHDETYRELAQELVAMKGHFKLGYEFWQIAFEISETMKSYETADRLGKLAWREVAQRNQTRLHQSLVAKRGSYHFIGFEPDKLAAALPSQVSKSWAVVNVLLLMELTQLLQPEWHMKIRRNIITTEAPQTILNTWSNWYVELRCVDAQKASRWLSLKLRVDILARISALIPRQYNRGSATTTDGVPINEALNAYFDDLFKAAQDRSGQ